MKQPLRTTLLLRLFTTLGFLALMLLFIHLSLDLMPNRVTVIADIPQGFSLPQINLTGSNQLQKTTVSSGQTLPMALTQYSTLGVEFPTQPSISGDKLLFVDFSSTSGNDISTWTTAIPTNMLISPQTHSMVLTSRCQDAQFRVFVGQNEWPIEAHEQRPDTFIARNNAANAISKAPIRITVEQPHSTIPADLRALTTCVGEVTALQTKQPVLIRGITLEKTFGRLGITIPLADWGSTELNQRFALFNPEGNISLDEEGLALSPGENLQIEVQYQGDLAALRQELKPQVNRILVIIYLIIGSLTFLFYLAFSWGVHQLSRLFNNLRLITHKGKDIVINWAKFLLANKPIKTTTLYRLFWLVVIILFLGLVIKNQTVQIQGYVGLLIFIILILAWAIIVQRFKEAQSVLFVKKTATSLFQRNNLLFIILISIAGFLLFFRLGTHDFFEDEFQVIAAAQGYQKTGTFFSWDWINQTITNSPYERAWPHTFLIAQSFRLFGVSEWSARAVSAISGLIFFIIFYYFARFFTNKRVAILSLFSAVFYITNYYFFRNTRMYALLIPLFLLLTYCLYRGLTGDWWIKTRVKWIDDLLSQYLNFDYRFFILSIPLLYLNYHIHYNSLIIVLVVFLYVCIMAGLTKSKKYVILVIFGFIGICGLILANVFNVLDRLPWVLGLITFFKIRNTAYFDYLFRHPLGTSAGFILIIIFLLKWFKQKKDMDAFHKELYLLTLTVTAVIFFIFIANRYTSSVYISHIMPIALILIISGFWYLIQHFPKRGVYLLLLFNILVLSNFIIVVPGFYSWNTPYGNFSTAYQVINDNYQEEDEVIFGQYLRTYYLQPLDNIRHISMRNHQTYSFSQFLDDLQNHKAGWITWETRKAYHIQPEILSYIDTHFLKLHGAGIDDTNVEVYYYSNPHTDPNVSD